MIKLRVHVPGRPPVVRGFAKSRITLGRSVRCDLVVDDPFVSRVHAELRCEETVCWVTDLGSANGTYVNGERVREAVPLVVGDRLQVGETTIEVLSVAGLSAEKTIVSGDPAHEELIARPERMLSGSAGVSVTPELLSVIGSVRAAARHPSLSAEAERSRRLLAVITEVGIALLSPLTLEEVLQRIVGLVMEIVPGERALLFLRDEAGGLVCKVACSRGPEPSEGEPVVRISRLVIEQVIAEGRSVLATDAQLDERFRHRESILLSGVRSILAVPLIAEQKVLGMIYVDNPVTAGAFSEEDRHILEVVASVAAVKIENARLLDQHMEHERIRQQLAHARELQMRLLPRVPPIIEGYDLAGISFPCYEVGGDYFDFIPLPEGQWGIAVGDVCGKGMDAALLMSSLHASVRAHALLRRSPAQIVAAVNRYLLETTAPQKFATLFLALLDPRAHRLTYTNAGHNPPLRLRAEGTLELLDAGGIPVGILETAAYVEQTLELDPGDLLVLFSDGVVESRDERGQEFGLARVQEVVRESRHCAAASVRDRLEEALTHFVGAARPTDDVTLVIVKRIA